MERVKKACTLTSLKDLGFTKRSLGHIEKKRFVEDLSLEDVVMMGRILAYGFELRPDFVKKAPKWRIELAVVLKNAGFVRPATDFSRYCHFGMLYLEIFGDSKASFITHVSDLSNEEYENFEVDEQIIDDAKLAIRLLLTEREFRILSDWYGLDGRYHPREEIELANRVSKGRATQYVEKALRKLKKHRADLPPIN